MLTIILDTLVLILQVTDVLGLLYGAWLAHGAGITDAFVAAEHVAAINGVRAGSVQ